jgi:hypothetical protein
MQNIDERNAQRKNNKQNKRTLVCRLSPQAVRCADGSDATGVGLGRTSDCRKATHSSRRAFNHLDRFSQRA